jgi:hypothetical protein
MALPAAFPPPHIAALQAAGFVMKADLAPLLTSAQLTAQLAALQAQMTGQLQAQMTGQLQAQMTALQAQMAGQFAALQTQIAALQAQMNGQFALLQAQLGQLGIPAIAGAASAIVHAIAAARAQNAHDERGVAYAIVMCDDGTRPQNWPAAGFTRDDLVEGPIATVDLLLADFGLPHGAPAALHARRNALARYIGAPRA